MRPHGVTYKNDLYIYHYDYSDLKAFLKRGFEYGDCGLILTTKDDNTKRSVFRGFGSIENPCKSLYTITCAHFGPFDGAWDPMAVMQPSQTTFPMESYRMVFIDNETGELTNESNIKNSNT